MKRVNIISTVVQRGISGEKISTGNTFIGSGVNINDIKRELSKDFMSLEEFKSYWEVKTDPFGNKYLYSLFHIATNKGVTMYSSTDTQKIPSILESIPTAGYDDIQARGMIAFNSSHFVINNGVVSAIQGSEGLDVEQLEDYLTSNKYATEDWVKQYVVDVNTGNITAITKQMVIDALEYTPYDASNPNGYITSATLDGYLPLTGGVIGGWVHIMNNKSTEGTLQITGVSTKPRIRFEGDFSWGYLGFGGANKPCYYDNALNEYNLIHSGNIGSQSVNYATSSGSCTGNAASATKLSDNTSFTVWGQEFFVNGKPKSVNGAFRLLGEIPGTVVIHKALVYPTSPYGLITRAYIDGDISLQVQREYNDSECFNLLLNPFGGNVGIGTTNPASKLDVVGDIKVGGVRLYKSQDGVLYLDGNLVVKGGVTMYGTDATSAPSILDSLPKASYGSGDNNKGIASFDGNYFRVTDGYVTLISDNVGINESALNAILDGKNYATKTDLSGYLPLTGGTISNVDYGALIVLRKSNQGFSGIRFSNWSGVLGYLGIGGSASDFPNQPTFIDTSLNAYGLIHSGNIGSQSVNYATSSGDADTLDGLHLSSIYKSISSSELGGTTANFDTLIVRFISTNANLNHPYGIVGGNQCIALNLHCGTNFAAQLAMGFGSNYLAYRNKAASETWNEWTKISAGYADVAYKLQTPRTLWGQSFDGSKDINGTFRLLQEILDTVKIHKVLVHPTNPFGLITRAYTSGTISLQSQRENSDNECFNLALNPLGGNVGIGTTNPEYKLDVNGSISVSADANITGDLRLKGSGNYGNTLYFGDGSYCYITEPSDDAMKIYGSKGVTIDGGVTYGLSVVSMASFTDNVGIGTDEPSYKLHVVGSAYISSNLLTGGGITMYSQRSLKNVVDERGLSLSELSEIKPTRYTWKDNRDNRIHFGGIADDIQQVLPEVVYKTEEGVLTMDYGNAGFAIAASLIKPVVDHEEKIRRLQKRVSELEQELNRLRA